MSINRLPSECVLGCQLPSSDYEHQPKNNMVLETISDDDSDYESDLSNNPSVHLDFSPSLLKYYRFLRSLQQRQVCDMDNIKEIIRRMRNIFDLSHSRCREHILCWMTNERDIASQIDLYDAAMKKKIAAIDAAMPISSYL